MKIIERRRIGVDLGIGSCGWAVLDMPEGAEPGKIVALGAWLFDVPETDKERKPTNQIRRTNRGMRRVLNRRRQRMNGVRALFKAHGLIESDTKTVFKDAKYDPWALRAAGLDRKLTALEFAVALAHIAKHRGFRSNSKRDRSNEPGNDSSKMLKAIDATREKLGAYRTAGEAFHKDRAFADRKRNRDGDFTRSILRKDHETEVALLFDRQRRLGSKLATADLEAAFVPLAFDQRPLADSEDRVGYCPFEKSERRAAKHSYAFEMFRFLSRLAALRIGKTERPLTQEEIAAAAKDFGAQNGMTFKRLRKLLALDDSERFQGVSPEDEGKRDVVNRNGNSFAGTCALKKTAGAAWASLLATPERLDRIATVLSFRESVDSIRAGLIEAGVEPPLLDAILKGVEDGSLSKFSGAGHISAKAARKIIPHLAKGMVYSEACAAAGYKHTDGALVSGETSLRAKIKDLAAQVEGSVNNPVARKSIGQALKQIGVLIGKFCLPGAIHVELARDVGKSAEERDEIKRGIDKRNADKDKLRAAFESALGRPPANAEELLRYELWREQNGRCIYSDTPIPVAAIAAADNSVQVDHILPWSRSGDDSFVNKTLCKASENQKKKDRTPYEWFSQEKPDEWNNYVARVEGLKQAKGRKKRNYLLKDASILEERFRSRNLNDTRYACRLLLQAAKALYPTEALFEARKPIVRAFARPGALTDRLRRAWNLQGHKKDKETGERIPDDRHHALDALIVAACDNGTLHRLTEAFKKAEAQGSRRDFSGFPPPWPEFRAQFDAKYAEVFVARAERRRARGEAHAATIKGIDRSEDAPVVYERKAVEKLTLKDLERIDSPERNAKLIDALRAWIEAGKQKGTKPLSPKGDPISKVRLRTTDNVAVEVRGGTADRGDMVRVDVFTKFNKRGKKQYFVVPIYPHQVADLEKYPKPPDRAVQAYTPESEWPVIDGTYEFVFSISPLSLLQLIKPDGEVIEGYFRGLDRTTGAFAVSLPRSGTELSRGIGAKTLLSIRKFQIDRLGNRHEVLKETRTWHGAVCT
jgi:CRISPR-associated endonuclease Csn1